MKIYTKTGDKGETSLFGGKRIPKNDPRIEAYGTVDELNSVIGIARAFAENPEIVRILSDIQSRLFVLGADLATPADVKNTATARITGEDAVSLEKLIDGIESQLPPLRSFILPGGSKSATLLHHARSVCRRAERLVVALYKSGETSESTIIFLNRLSDLLFELARYANKIENVDEILWGDRKSSGSGR